MNSKTGFYKQGSSLLHVISNENGKTVSVHDWETNAYFVWEKIPKDAVFLDGEYSNPKVQDFLKTLA